MAVAAFAAGAVGAGAALGWALGSASSWAGGGSTHAVWAAAAVVAAYAAREVGLLRLPIPSFAARCRSGGQVLPVAAQPGSCTAPARARLRHVRARGASRRSPPPSFSPTRPPARSPSAHSRGRAAAYSGAGWAARLGRRGRPVKQRRGPVAAAARRRTSHRPPRVPWRAGRGARCDRDAGRSRRGGAARPRLPIMSPIRLRALGAYSRGQVNGGVLQGKLRVNGVSTTSPEDANVDGTRVVVDTGSEFEIVDTGSLAVLRTLQLKGTEPALFDHWLVYRRVTTRRHLILYDLSTNRSRVIATVKIGAISRAPPSRGAGSSFWSRVGAGARCRGSTGGTSKRSQGPSDPDLGHTATRRSTGRP